MKYKYPLLKSSVLWAGMALATTAFSFLLVGCSGHKQTKAVGDYSSAAAGQLRQQAMADLQASGVRIIRLGQTYRLVIASHQLFKPNSADLTNDALPLLSKVAHFLNAYSIITVRVAAYSANAGSRSHAIVLTQRQATVIQHYLSDCGLKARLIYADGQGNQHPVASNHLRLGKQANRRIEIYFMKA